MYLNLTGYKKAKPADVEEESLPQTPLEVDGLTIIVNNV